MWLFGKNDTAMKNSKNLCNQKSQEPIFSRNKLVAVLAVILLLFLFACPLNRGVNASSSDGVILLSVKGPEKAFFMIIDLDSLTVSLPEKSVRFLLDSAFSEGTESASARALARHISRKVNYISTTAEGFGRITSSLGGFDANLSKGASISGRRFSGKTYFDKSLAFDAFSGYEGDLDRELFAPMMLGLFTRIAKSIPFSSVLPFIVTVYRNVDTDIPIKGAFSVAKRLCSLDISAVR